MGITSNVDHLVNAWERRARAIAPVMRKATADATKVIHAEAKAQLNKLIYDKPVPTRAEAQGERMGRQQAKGKVTGYGGKDMGFATKGSRFGPQKGGGMAYKSLGAKQGNKPAWKRTGNLKRSERMRIQSPFLGIVYNSAKYAAPRHEAGKPGRRKTRYPAPWRDKAITSKRDQVREIYRVAMRSAIRQGVIPGGGF